jgi:hypothetical protein
MQSAAAGLWLLATGFRLSANDSMFRPEASSEKPGAKIMKTCNLMELKRETQLCPHYAIA